MEILTTTHFNRVQQVSLWRCCISGVWDFRFWWHELWLLCVWSGDHHHVHDDWKQDSYTSRRSCPCRVWKCGPADSCGEGCIVSTCMQSFLLVTCPSCILLPAIPRKWRVSHDYCKNRVETLTANVWHGPESCRRNLVWNCQVLRIWNLHVTKDSH